MRARAHDVLWDAVKLIQGGARFVLTFADWAARQKRFEAVQLLWPDKAGSFPDDPAYAGPAQPLLD
jgi:hypothetical protein